MRVTADRYTEQMLELGDRQFQALAGNYVQVHEALTAFPDGYGFCDDAVRRTVYAEEIISYLTDQDGNASHDRVPVALNALHEIGALSKQGNAYDPGGYTEDTHAAVSKAIRYRCQRRDHGHAHHDTPVKDALEEFQDLDDLPDDDD